MGRKRKGIPKFSSESEFDADGEVPTKSGKKKQKRQQPVPARRRRAAARNVSYTVDETEESDLEPDDKNQEQESSDYIPSKSADSTEEPSAGSGGDREIEMEEEGGSSDEPDEELLTPTQRRKNTSTPRSSDRLKHKKRRRFSIPSRDEVFKQIDYHSPTKGLSELQPRRLVNNFTKVYNSYNHDPNYTSGESSVEDFIDDESSEEERRQRRKKQVKKTERKRRTSRLIRPESSSSGSDCDEEKRNKPKMNRSRIESSDSDSDAPVQATKRRNTSMIVDSDSGLEDVAVKESMGFQMDGVDDENNTVNTGKDDSNKSNACGSGDTKIKEENTFDVSSVVKTAGENSGVNATDTKNDTAHTETIKDSENKQENLASPEIVPVSKQRTPPSEFRQKAREADTKSTTPKTKTGGIQDVELDEDDVKLLVEVDSDDSDSIEEFIVNSDYEDVENVEPEDSGNADSEEDINVSNCQNRQFIASDSDSQDANQVRRSSKRAQLMERKRQVQKDKFKAFRKTAKKKAHETIL